MRRWMKWSLLTSIGAGLLFATGALAQRESMSFFITSVGPGKGADLGGLSGADRHCQSLASAAGPGKRTWHAYLSAAATATTPAVNARDRIGKGPWQNANGAVIARDIEQLHTANSISKQTALTEKGDMVKGVGDTPNMHDILTGTQADGRAFSGDKDMTCGNWTKGGDGSAMVGHHDRMAGRRRCVEVLERIAPVARLQPGGAARHRGRRLVLLLRGQLSGVNRRPPSGSIRRGASARSPR